MSGDHRRPLLAFVLVAIACTVVIVTSVRGQAMITAAHHRVMDVVAGAVLQPLEAPAVTVPTPAQRPPAAARVRHAPGSHASTGPSTGETPQSVTSPHSPAVASSAVRSATGAVAVGSAKGAVAAGHRHDHASPGPVGDHESATKPRSRGRNEQGGAADTHGTGRARAWEHAKSAWSSDPGDGRGEAVGGAQEPPAWTGDPGDPGDGQGEAVGGAQEPPAWTGDPGDPGDGQGEAVGGAQEPPAWTGDPGDGSGGGDASGEAIDGEQPTSGWTHGHGHGNVDWHGHAPGGHGHGRHWSATR